MKHAKSILMVLGILAIAAPFVAREPEAVLIPTKYVNGTFFAQPVTDRGDQLTFYTDTGGGLWIKKSTVEKDKLVSQSEGEQEVLSPWPKFKPGKSIPQPLGGSLVVMPEHEDMPAWTRDWDGMLGQQWFSGRVWTFDYPRQQLWLHNGRAVPRVDSAHVATLGFRRVKSGQHETDFARIRAEIDGETLDLLFDTGAQTFLSAPAQAALKLDSSVRAASFIIESVSERWRKKHPDWRYINKAEERTGAAMIEVPQITVGGYAIGPVWFTVRPDKAFHEYMAQWMDRAVEGALGGSALHYLRVTVDYPNEKAYFERGD